MAHEEHHEDEHDVDDEDRHQVLEVHVEHRDGDHEEEEYHDVVGGAPEAKWNNARGDPVLGAGTDPAQRSGDTTPIN